MLIEWIVLIFLYFLFMWLFRIFFLFIILKGIERFKENTLKDIKNFTKSGQRENKEKQREEREC